MRRLTDLQVRSAESRDVQYTLWDSLTGFGLRVSPGGTKTWTVVHGRDRRRITLGRYPLMELKEAREAARRLLAEVTLGGERPSTMKLGDLIELFFEVRCTPQNNKSSTITEYRRIFKRHLSPLIDLKLTDITYRRIHQILDNLASRPIEANHAFVAIRMLLRFAHQRRLLHHNPLDGMSLPYASRSRDRVLHDAEVAAVWRAAHGFPFPFGHIVSLLLLTGQRLSEVSGLQWIWIDPNEMTITLPASVTKNSTKHTFPYGLMTRNIFESIPRLSAHLFPPRDLSGAYVGHNKAKGRFDAGCPLAHWTLHDLRRTFSTVHARIGTHPHVTEALLNHRTGTRSPIQRIYDRHTYIPEMRAAMENYEKHLLRIVKQP